MTRPSPAVLAVFLLAVTAVLAGATLAKGGLYFDTYEGDTLHLLDIVLREARGQWPHLDFETPIGLLATAPIALFVRMGAGAGHAMLYAQVLVATLALPAIWWASLTRFRGAYAYAFGGLSLVLLLALVYGGTDPAISMSMHYNRWAWAAAFVAVALAVLPPDEEIRAPVLDGVIVGAALAALALLKVTYFIAFLPAIAVALIGHRAVRTIAAAAATGLAIAAALTLLAGPGFWPAYIGDLLSVLTSEVRPRGSASLAEAVNSPERLGASIVLLASVMLLRQADRKLEGFVLLLLAPAFFYVTFQNFGNDPKWTWFLGLFLLRLRPAHEVRGEFGYDTRQPIFIAAVLSLAFATPSLTNMAFSPLRHLGVDTAGYVPLLPGSGAHTDLQMPGGRLMAVTAMVTMDGAGQPFAEGRDPVARQYSATFDGTDLPDCQIDSGFTTVFTTISEDLEAAGLVDGKTVLAADLISPYWLYGAGEPLSGAAPWYYGGLPGWDSVDYLLIPMCPISMGVRKLFLDAVADAGAPLTEVRRNELYLLYTK